MEQQAQKIHSFYRIRGLEYTDDGCCWVGVQMKEKSRPYQYKLSHYCYRWGWLKHFRQQDLEHLCRLVGAQATVAGWKRLMCYSLVKVIMIKEALANWEEEAKRYLSGVGRDFEDW